jgi:transposase
MPKYDVKYKKKVLRYYYKYGLASTVKKFGRSKSVIYTWKRKSETFGLMRKKTKTYTREEKLEIVNHYWKYGRTETEKNFDISGPVVYKWERLLREYGPEGLDYDGRGRKPSFLGPEKDLNKDADLLAENQRLRMENLYLKKLDALVQKREEQERKKKLK